MSVILFDAEKFEVVAAALKNHVLRRTGLSVACMFGYPEGWDQRNGMDSHIEAFCVDLARSNSATWNRQYRETDSTPLCNFKRGRMPISDVALYKSLQSIRYNLADNEGDSTDLNKCGHILDRLISCLASKIISEQLPEYEKAPWA